MLLFEDPGITPLTRHARWFLESLDVMSFAAVATSLLSLFRPTVYRLSIVPRERRAASRLLEADGRSSLDTFKCGGQVGLSGALPTLLPQLRRVGSPAIVWQTRRTEEEIEPTPLEVLLSAPSDWVSPPSASLFPTIYRRWAQKAQSRRRARRLAWFTLDGQRMSGRETVCGSSTGVCGGS